MGIYQILILVYLHVLKCPNKVLLMSLTGRIENTRGGSPIENEMPCL
jgi:hypothetical protein